MGSAEVVPEKVAWVLVRDGRVLVTRNRGVDVFYFPGGKREPGESDAETLAREIDEELQSRIDTATMVHVGTYPPRATAGATSSGTSPGAGSGAVDRARPGFGPRPDGLARVSPVQDELRGAGLAIVVRRGHRRRHPISGHAERAH